MQIYSLNEISMKEQSDKEQKRILVLCVDRDGDLGAKAGVKTPVVGRQENLNAAMSLALKDPEEPDANAIFEAVRIYDRLKAEDKQEEVLEVATLSGSELGGISADRKVVAELGDLLGSFSASEVILVTDGYSDEAVLPVVQSRVPVSSVRRIVVKHSESIEETAALFSRYLRTIVDNPRYSRIALGLPGLFILILAILSLFGLVQYYVIIFVLGLSVVLLVKGFGIDRTARGFYKWMREYSPPPIRVQISSFSAVAGALCIMLGIYWGVAGTASEVTPQPDIASYLATLPRLAGFFIGHAITLIVIGICVALLGRAIRWYLERDSRLLRNGAFIVSIAWSRQIFISASEILTGSAGPEQIVLAIIIGILIGVASVLIVFVVHRRTKDFFQESKEQVEEFGKD
jgi:putative membrane protein